jgi:leucyl aminopeptidase
MSPELIIEYSPSKSGYGCAHVVFAAADAVLVGAAAAIEAATGGQLSRAIGVSPRFGRVATLIEILAPAGSSCSRLLVVSLGELDVADSAVFEKIGAAIASALLNSGEREVIVDLTGLQGLPIPIVTAGSRLGHGAMLRSYTFDRYKTKRKPETQRTLERMTIIGAGADTDSTAASRTELAALAAGVFLARDLVSEPPNVIYPTSFVEYVRAAAGPGLGIEVLGEQDMTALGMGAFLGVSRGSPHEAKILVMRWNGGARAKPIVLVGKGVTFDAGGISLKPSPYIEQMKWDMAGAAAVVGTLHALAGRNARANVVGICGLVENMPDGKAQRPSDVVRSMSGQTIEIVNTDAEGRLVLCDLFSWAQKIYAPEVIVDLATLTGALIAGLGREYGWLFSNDEDLSRRLQEAGKAVGEKLWPMPMGDVYDRTIDSTIADMKNLGPEEGSPIAAAQFLLRFIGAGVKWAHLDITAKVWAKKPTDLAPEGATGYGVRLLDHFIKDLCETAPEPQPSAARS